MAFVTVVWRPVFVPATDRSAPRARPTATPASSSTTTSSRRSTPQAGRCSLDSASAGVSVVGWRDSTALRVRKTLGGASSAQHCALDRACGDPHLSPSACHRRDTNPREHGDRACCCVTTWWSPSTTPLAPAWHTSLDRSTRNIAERSPSSSPTINADSQGLAGRHDMQASLR